MEGSLLFSHPVWFLCSLVQLVILWARRPRGWRPESCPVDLAGKTALVTGASGGIGKAVALDLARRHARTILLCRRKDAGQAVLEEIRRRTGNPDVHLRLADLSSMASVRGFSGRFLEEEARLDILVNNAGISGFPHALTPEGLPVTHATNFLGPFLLTNLLMGAMKASAGARIVNVSSFRHYCGKVDLQCLSGTEQLRGQAYDDSKLLNVVFTIELARRLQGTGVTVNAVSPGVVRTDIMRYYNFLYRLIFRLCGIFLKAPKEGAVSTLFCAVSEEAGGISGKYFDSSCCLAQPLPLAQDAAVGSKLWDAAERLTGLRTERASGPQ